MSAANWLWSIVEFILWYFFLSGFIYVLKNPVDIYRSALVLLVLVYAATIACPWVRNSSGWRRMTGKESPTNYL